MFKALAAFQTAHHAWCVSDQSARDESRLFDACIEMGMDRDEPSVEAWAARKAFVMEGGVL